MRHFFTKEQKEFIEKNIKGISRKEMLSRFNKQFNTGIKINQLVAFMKNNGITSGRNARFKKGQKAWNKGVKGLNTGGEKGWFKKGQQPWNYQPVGSERINTEGYTDIKIADNVWKQKHRIIWEEANGPIPKDHAVIFGDGNKRNLDLDNLILVTRAQLVRLNNFDLIKDDANLTRTGVIIADIIAKTIELKDS